MLTSQEIMNKVDPMLKHKRDVYGQPESGVTLKAYSAYEHLRQSIFPLLLKKKQQ